MSATLTRLPSTTGPASRTTPSPDGPPPPRRSRATPGSTTPSSCWWSSWSWATPWTLVAHTFTTSWAYNFLYLWHVPAFVMVTGYLSRSFRFTRRHLTKLLTSVVVPYLIFEYTLTTFRSVVGGEHHGPLFLNPHWPMWYLATLFVWRLATPLLKRMPYALPAAVVVSLIGGAFTGDTLDLARATGCSRSSSWACWPPRSTWRPCAVPAARLAALGAFSLALVASTAIEDTLGSEWLYYRSSYAQLHDSLVAGALTRLVLLAASGALAVAFVTLVPRRALWFTTAGLGHLGRLPLPRLPREARAVLRLPPLVGRPPGDQPGRSPPWSPSRSRCCWPHRRWPAASTSSSTRSAPGSGTGDVRRLRQRVRPTATSARSSPRERTPRPGPPGRSAPDLPGGRGATAPTPPAAAGAPARDWSPSSSRCSR